MKERLGKSTSLVTRDTVYLVDDGFEVEAREHYEVIERRVLFDDVQLVTYHRHLGAVYLVVHGGIAIVFLGFALALGTLSSDAWVGALFVAAFGVPSLIAFILRLLFRMDVITIYGRRSKASIRFSLRKAKARETYGRICAAVRQAQRPSAEPAVPSP